MSRPTDWSALDRASDPVPGDPTFVASTGRLYVGTADAILRAAENLSTALSDRFGQSEAIDAIREQAEDVARRITRAEERYRGVGDAMIVYAPKLSEAQQKSVDALNKAIEAQSAAGTAESMAQYYQRQVDDPTTPPANLAHLRERLSHWETAGGTARQSSATAAQELAGAESIRDAAAGVAIEAIRLVENSGDLNDSTWDNFTQWVSEHKDLLDMIGNVLGTIAAIAGAILLFIPGVNLVVGAILAVIVVANIAYQALNAAAQISTGNMSLAEGIVNVGLAVLNIVGAGVAMKAAATATRTTVATSLMRSYAGSGIRGMTQARATALVERAGIAASGPGAMPTGLQSVARALGLNPRKLSMVHAMASGQMLSGNLATGAMRPLWYATAGVGALNTGTAFAENSLSDALEPHIPDIGWRLGGNW